MGRVAKKTQNFGGFFRDRHVRCACRDHQGLADFSFRKTLHRDDSRDWMMHGFGQNGAHGFKVRFSNPCRQRSSGSLDHCRHDLRDLFRRLTFPINKFRHALPQRAMMIEPRKVADRFDRLPAQTLQRFLGREFAVRDLRQQMCDCFSIHDSSILRSCCRAADLPDR